MICPLDGKYRYSAPAVISTDLNNVRIVRFTKPSSIMDSTKRSEPLVPTWAYWTIWKGTRILRYAAQSWPHRYISTKPEYISQPTRTCISDRSSIFDGISDHSLCPNMGELNNYETRVCSLQSCPWKDPWNLHLEHCYAHCIGKKLIQQK